MAFANSSILKTPTVLEQLLEEINFQRTKEMRQLLKDGKLRLRTNNILSVNESLLNHACDCAHDCY